LKSAIGLLVLVSLAAFGQESRTGYIPNSVSVSAEGDSDAAPDTAVVTCSISAQEKTSQAAFESASRLADQMRQALRNAGIDPKSAELSRYSLYPVFDYKDPKQKVMAYRGGTSVTIKLKDFGKIAPVIEALAGLDGITGQNMTYELEEVDAAKQRAIDKAYARARIYAETLARSSGRQLGGLVSATVDIQQVMPVMPYARVAMMSQAAKAPGPTEEFQAEKIKVSAHVNAVFSLQ